MCKAIMAATLAAAVLISANSANALVVNGNFEDTTTLDPTGLVNNNELSKLATTGSSWDVFSEINGWKTSDGAGIEVQTNRTLTTVDAHSGQHYIELDSHPKPNSNSTMEQEVALGTGGYELSFWYSPRNSDVDSNGIFYQILGLVDQTLVEGPDPGPPVIAVGQWTEITAIFHVATAGLYDLSFAATGKENTYGGFIDTVSITAVPVPAAGLLLPAGIAALGLVSRRRRKTDCGRISGR